MGALFYESLTQNQIIYVDVGRIQYTSPNFSKTDMYQARTQGGESGHLHPLAIPGRDVGPPEDLG